MYAAQEGQQQVPAFNQRDHQARPASMQAFSIYPIVRGTVEFCDVCTIRDIRSLNPLFEQASQVFIEKKLSYVLLGAQFVWRGPAMILGKDGEDDAEEWPWGVECLVTHSPRLRNDITGNKLYQFDLNDIALTENKLTTNWDLLDGMDLYIPRDYTGVPTWARSGVHVKFYLDEEEHDIDEFMEWEEAYEDEYGSTVMIGRFILLRAADEDGTNEGFGDFFEDEIEVKVGVKTEGEYWKVWLVEFCDDGITSWGMSWLLRRS